MVGSKIILCENPLRPFYDSRLVLIATVFLSFIGTNHAQAQTNLYFNNTITGTRNWGGTNGANGFWATDPNGGSFRTITTLNDIVNFSTNASLPGTTDVFTGAGQAAYGLNFGVGPNANGPFRIRASFNTNNARTFTIGAGGITVNSTVQGVSFSNRDSVSGNLTGELNTVLQASQTWTNNSSSALDFGGRLVGTSDITLTKNGTGSLVLSNDNASAIVGNTTGLNGKILVNQGTLKIGHANALGIRDPLTSAVTSASIGTLSSDTIIAPGATLDTNNFSVGNEFITISGAGVNGNGAIVNNNASSVVFNTFGQVKMAGNATIGGTGYWDISPLNFQRGKLFQDGFTLTKTGTNTVGLYNTDVIGGGDIDIQQGRLNIHAGTVVNGPGKVLVRNDGSLNFIDFRGNMTRDIVLENGAIQTFEGGTATVNSNVTISGLTRVFTNNTSSDGGRGGAVNFVGNVDINSSGSLEIYGNGTIGMNLVPHANGGNKITIVSGGFDILNSAPAAAFINFPAIGNSSSLGGEGNSTGPVTVRNASNFRLYFDPTTTGPTQHLRVGSFDALNSQIKVVPTTPIVSGSGIVVLESASNDLSLASFHYDGRGVLSTDSSKLYLDYQAGNLVWLGNNTISPRTWDTGSTTNWGNPQLSTADVFYSGDRTTFNDTVGGTSAVVRPLGTVSPLSMTIDNSAVNYTFAPLTASDRISFSSNSLIKSGSGTANLQTISGGVGHQLPVVDVQSGILEFTYTGNGTAVTSSIASTIIRNGGTLRNNLAVPNMGIGENPIAIEPGGTFELTRGATPNSSGSTPAITAMRSQFSGGGNVRLRGVAGPGFVDSFGDYITASDNSGFSGRWILDNSRLRVDNVQGDELGTASVKVVQGGQVLLNATAATRFEGNTFEIEGTGWAYEPAANGGGFGALKFAIAGATIGANSSIVLTNDARISAQNITSGVILAPISGHGKLEYGNPTATQNGNLIIGGSNTYTGNTSIENHLIMANHNSAFSNGTVSLNGYTTARTTQLAVGNGILINNDIEVGTFAGQNGRGAIEGGSTQQTADLGTGVGTISGTIKLLGSQAGDRGHFGSGGGVGSVLRVTGPINIDDPANNPVSHRFSTAGGYTQFEGGAGNYTKFDLKGGTVRLGTNNGLRSGVELLTRTAATAGTFDLHGFDQTVNRVVGGNSTIGSSFRLINSGIGTSTLTIAGLGNSDIQSIPLQPGIVNIIKEGPGGLMLSGTTADLGNTGHYTINGGEFRIADGQRAGASLALNAGLLSGNGVIVGNCTIAGGTISPGASAGHLRFENDLAVGNDASFMFEISSVAGFENSFYDHVTVGGTLDLLNLNQMNINVIGLAPTNSPGMVSPSAFNPLQNFQWTLFDTSNAILGFDPNDFSIETSTFSIENPFSGSFEIGLANGNTDLVLNYFSPVPEPSSCVMVVAGLGILCFRRVRDRQRMTR